jgi:uncharacterized protein (DUF1778 family)
MATNDYTVPPRYGTVLRAPPDTVRVSFSLTMRPWAKRLIHRAAFHEKLTLRKFVVRAEVDHAKEALSVRDDGGRS